MSLQSFLIRELAKQTKPRYFPQSLIKGGISQAVSRGFLVMGRGSAHMDVPQIAQEKRA